MTTESDKTGSDFSFVFSIPAIDVLVAVEPAAKLAATWGELKAY